MKNYGHVFLEQNRFGSEDTTGRTILEHRTVANSQISVVIRDNFVPTTDYTVKLFTFPEFFEMTGNFGVLGGAGTKGIWTGPSADPQYAQRGVAHIRDIARQPYYLDGTGSAALNLALAGKARDADAPSRSNAPAFVDLVASYRAQDVLSVITSTSISAANVAFPYLGGYSTRKITATADNAKYVLNASSSVLTTMAVNPDLYTWVFDCVVVTTSPISCLDLFQRQPAHRHAPARAKRYSYRRAAVVTGHIWLEHRLPRSAERCDGASRADPRLERRA